MCCSPAAVETTFAAAVAAAIAAAIAAAVAAAMAGSTKREGTGSLLGTTCHVGLINCFNTPASLMIAMNLLVTHHDSPEVRTAW